MNLSFFFFDRITVLHKVTTKKEELKLHPNLYQSTYNYPFFSQSLNHLLNFQYSPRGNGPESDRRSRGLRAPPRGNKPVYRQTFR